MIDHVSIRVSDFARSRAFYVAALAPLGYGVIMEFEGGVGLGSQGHPYFWMGAGEPGGPVHIAFRTTRASVDDFHAAALQAGGTDNGGPGLRPQYHTGYYAAFVLDPDGNNIEAVCHEPE
jgi:catechol 2,3-dioxygenase-like lactoylglutathione lyase family enzyme